MAVILFNAFFGFEQRIMEKKGPFREQKKDSGRIMNCGVSYRK